VDYISTCDLSFRPSFQSCGINLNNNPPITVEFLCTSTPNNILTVMETTNGNKSHASTGKAEVLYGSERGEVNTHRQRRGDSIGRNTQVTNAGADRVLVQVDSPGQSPGVLRSCWNF